MAQGLNLQQLNKHIILKGVEQIEYWEERIKVLNAFKMECNYLNASFTNTSFIMQRS